MLTDFQGFRHITTALYDSVVGMTTGTLAKYDHNEIYDK